MRASRPLLRASYPSGCSGLAQANVGALDCSSERVMSTIGMRSERIRVGWVSRHVTAVAVISIAVATTGAVFAFARPTYHPYVMPKAPNNLPYTAVTYSVADARRAFAAVDLRLAPHVPRAVTAGITTLWSKGYVVEVDVFGDPKVVKDSGFSDYYTFANGRWSLAPKSCVPGAKNAERWRGNVRVIVSCTASGAAATPWLTRVSRALGRL